MTESELLNQKAKLKAMYTQNMNTTRQNSLNEMNADKASYTTDANNQLQEQKDTTLNTKTNADIQAFNNAKKLRELASANGFTNGGELYSGVLQNDQQKANTIGSANSDFSKYKTQWDQKLNEYNTKWNNNLNKLNSETDNAINEYNTKLDMEYQDKINSLRAAQAAAAKSSAASNLSKSEMYDYALQKLNQYMDQNSGYIFLHDSKDSLINSIGQSNYDKLLAYYDKNASDTDYTASGAMKKISDPNRNVAYSGYITEPQGPAVPSGLNTTSTKKTSDNYTEYWNKLQNMFFK